MKQLLLLSAMLFLVVACQNTPAEEQTEAAAQTETEKPVVLSPAQETMAMVDGAHVHIDYSSPRVRERVIFGELVPFDKLWRSGANAATWIETDKNLSIDGQTLEAGKYSLFTIPSEGNWTIILNKVWDQRGTSKYNMEEDALRFEVSPEQMEELTEELTYSVEATGDAGGVIALTWENTRVAFPFSVEE